MFCILTFILKKTLQLSLVTTTFGTLTLIGLSSQPFVFFFDLVIILAACSMKSDVFYSIDAFCTLWTPFVAKMYMSKKLPLNPHTSIFFLFFFYKSLK